MRAEEIRELDARAVRASVAVVSRVNVEHLDRATPCAEWTLGELLSHMTGQHHGFAVAAAGNGADPAVWRPRPLGDDPVATYIEAADRVIAAFAEDGALDREFAVPEISTEMGFPAPRAIGFHLVDYVVHGWDVARSLRVPFDPDRDLLSAALSIAEAVPDGERRLAPGAAFGPGVPVSSEASPLDRTVAALGRSPAWPH